MSEMPHPMPVFPATLTSTPSGKDGLTDADTLWLDVDLLHDHDRGKRKCRLARVNAAELNTQAGQDARAFVADWLGNEAVVVYYHGPERYGRWLVDLWRVSDGANLSDALLANSHAVPMSLAIQMVAP